MSENVSRRPRAERAARMAPLAVLPVFLKLKGRRVVVAGGSEAAVWKAELLAAAGAEVAVYAEDPCTGMLDLAEAPPAAETPPLGRRPPTMEPMGHVEYMYISLSLCLSLYIYIYI